MKKNILDIEVSCFANYQTANNPQKVTLQKWLKSKKYQDKIIELRASNTKERRNILKSQLPAITTSGLFSYRSAKDLIKHSGFLQVDIDFEDNIHISNYDKLKEQLINIENFAYIGLSASGKGYWGLIPILYPEKHKAHFDALKQVFTNLGIKIDSSCRDVCRLRGYSIDNSSYFNYHAKPFSKVVQTVYSTRRNKTNNFFNQSNDSFLNCINTIQRMNIDISNGEYQSWFEIGCAIANEYSVEGLEYFIAVSNQYHGKQSIDPKTQYSNCMRSTNSYGIGTFYYYCKLQGITFK